MGAIQKAISDVGTTIVAGAVAGKKLYEAEGQASAKASAQAQTEEEASRVLNKEAEETALEADLIKMGADPESARNFLVARSLGLDTEGFPMIRKKGKFVGKYSSVAEKLAKDSLTHSFASRAINEKGFADRIMKLGGTRTKRVEALLGASKGEVNNATKKAK